MFTSVASEQPISAGVPAGLSSIVSECRQKNPRNGISGALYYRLGRYLQIIEGKTATVDHLMSKIINDSRHKECVIQLDIPIRYKSFPRWQCQLSLALERDPYLRQFLDQYDSQLKAMDTESKILFNHFFKKMIKQDGNDSNSGLLANKNQEKQVNVFGCEAMSLNKYPNLSGPKFTPFMQKICHTLDLNSYSFEQLVIKYGKDKHDEILILLKKLNRQGLLQFKPMGQTRLDKKK